MKVQCLIPKYNNGSFFKQAIESLINQTIPFDSILICENHSKDGSEKMGFEYADKYSHVNCFMPDAFAKTFGESVSELIKRIDYSADYIVVAGSDDIWVPNFNEEMIQFIKTSGVNLTTAYCDRWQIDEKNRKIGVSGNLKTKTIIPHKNQEAFKYFSAGCSYIISGAYFKTNIFNDLEVLAKKTQGAFDWFLMLEAARLGSVGYNAKLLFNHRMHENNTTKTQIQKSYIPYENYYSLSLKEKDPEFSRIFEDIRGAKTIKNVSKNTNKIKGNIIKKIKFWMRLTGLFDLIRRR